MRTEPQKEHKLKCQKEKKKENKSTFLTLHHLKAPENTWFINTVSKYWSLCQNKLCLTRKSSRSALAPRAGSQQPCQARSVSARDKGRGKGLVS